VSQRPFLEELPEILRERRMTQRDLARRAGVSQSHLSRLLRGTDYKTRASVSLIEAVSAALALPSDYWPEVREQYVIGKIRDDAALRDRLYGQLKRR
jgi:transcriptional regulator with XRE-family HTH domain